MDHVTLPTTPETTRAGGGQRIVSAELVETTTRTVTVAIPADCTNDNDALRQHLFTALGDHGDQVFESELTILDGPTGTRIDDATLTVTAAEIYTDGDNETPGNDQIG